MENINIINALLVFVVFFGLLGTLFPALPGTAIILAAAVLHGLASNFAPLDWKFLFILTLVFLIGYGGQYAITAAGSKKMGASRYGIIGACLGMFAGLVLPIPGGIFAGTFIGAIAFEIIFDYKELQEALKAGVGALIGTLLSLFFEFMVGLLMAVLIFYRLYR
ncbi:MAG: DUF456 domain-containing protein [Proteobacteria bacterium]|nr:DUF456 domain-containing protein [Pseudomonadota bacterium]MBU1739397.1 DUF456 domain-containing protein [Pseudomonadota bacterium]